MAENLEVQSEENLQVPLGRVEEHLHQRVTTLKRQFEIVSGRVPDPLNRLDHPADKHAANGVQAEYESAVGLLARYQKRDSLPHADRGKLQAEVSGPFQHQIEVESHHITDYLQRANEPFYSNPDSNDSGFFEARRLQQVARDQTSQLDAQLIASGSDPARQAEINAEIGRLRVYTESTLPTWLIANTTRGRALVEIAQAREAIIFYQELGNQVKADFASKRVPATIQPVAATGSPVTAPPPYSPPPYTFSAQDRMAKLLENGLRIIFPN